MLWNLLDFLFKQDQRLEKGFFSPLLQFRVLHFYFNKCRNKTQLKRAGLQAKALQEAS